MKGGRSAAAPGFAATDDGDPIAEGEEHARQMVALAPKAVESAIALHHGTLEMPGPDKADGVFAITLPPPSESRR